MATDLAMAILVVEDYRTMAQIVRGLLAQIGFKEVDTVPDGPTALARMHEKKYGLVISDWNMAPMSGYELLRAVRSDPVLKKTPFIMVTGETKMDNVIAAKRAGVDNYLIKPFTAHALKSKIDAALAYPGELSMSVSNQE
jgi:two-component system, chemotaxis family, chemotaxis protein CheY